MTVNLGYVPIHAQLFYMFFHLNNWGRMSIGATLKGRHEISYDQKEIK